MAILSSLKPESAQKVLVYGDSGNGKTIFSTSFPGPLKVLDFDGKITSAASHWTVHSKERLDLIDVDNFQELNADTAQFAKFHTALVALETAARDKKFPFATVVLDSLTTWSEALMREIIRQNPGIKGAAPGLPGLQHYGIFGGKFREYLGRILALPCHVVVTAHIDINKDENTGEILRRPLTIGRNAAYLPIIFGEVYRAFTEVKDGRVGYWAQTQATPQYQARTQISGLPPRIELTYSSLTKKY